MTVTSFEPGSLRRGWPPRPFVSVASGCRYAAQPRRAGSAWLRMRFRLACGISLESWFLRGSDTMCPGGKSIRLLRARSSSEINWRRSFPRHQAIDLAASACPHEPACRTLAETCQPWAGPTRRDWLGLGGSFCASADGPTCGQIGCVEIVLAGNPDQGEQGIAAGIGEGSA